MGLRSYVVRNNEVFVNTKEKPPYSDGYCSEIFQNFKCRIFFRRILIFCFKREGNIILKWVLHGGSFLILTASKDLPSESVPLLSCLLARLMYPGFVVAVQWK